jgi:hypothetical protein
LRVSTARPTDPDHPSEAPYSQGEWKMRKIAMVATAVMVVAGTAVGLTDDGFRRIREALSGHKEVPVISTTGSGVFTATINSAGTEIRYELKYADLEGDILQSHIHFGPPNNTGGISVWLCSNLASPPTPAGVQPCPADPAVIEGVITAADVMGPMAQGIEPGAFSELLAAIRAGKTYVNIHTSKWPAGEIRSQISHDSSDHRDHD